MIFLKDAHRSERNYFTKLIFYHFKIIKSLKHTYYPDRISIIKRYVADYNLPYTSYPFYYAVRSHF
ncbi:hypothetical protein FLACOL7796_04244 [Flavobacterium collinsii]|uniref:Uncharacterized protein n=1 Tax=Flavobacterium collinsii TaxID=1114861 RepID=A0ABN7EQ06_9FLAO|nr:hypothetical protein FLACOL7796_04244 [Flavobacterium collinsii]